MSHNTNSYHSNSHDQTTSKSMNIPGYDRYAGGAYENSPAPSSLPLPSWKSKSRDGGVAGSSSPVSVAPIHAYQPSTPSARHHSHSHTYTGGNGMYVNESFVSDVSAHQEDDYAGLTEEEIIDKQLAATGFVLNPRHNITSPTKSKGHRGRHNKPNQTVPSKQQRPKSKTNNFKAHNHRSTGNYTGPTQL